MKGPILFLVSLVGVAVGGVLLLRPIQAERDRMAEEIVTRASDLPTGTNRAPTPEQSRLVLAAGLTRGPDDAPGVVRRLAMDFAGLDQIVIVGRRVEFPVPWEDVPRLLSRLGSQRGLVFDEVRIRPGTGSNSSLVTLLLATPPAGFGVR